MRACSKGTVAAVIALLATFHPVFAQQQKDGRSPGQGTPGAEAFVPPCQGAVWWAASEASFEDFDFLIGVWQVFDRESGLLMGIDVVEKIFEGCVIHQHWRHLNDRFSLPGSSWRLEGGSHTALGSDGLWHQTWLDNAGSYIHVQGGLDAEGVMVLESEWISFTSRQGRPVTLKYRWHWQHREDGTIHNWGLRAVEGGERPRWQKMFDIVYRKNVPGGPRVRVDEDAEAGDR